MNRKWKWRALLCALWLLLVIPACASPEDAWISDAEPAVSTSSSGASGVVRISAAGDCTLGGDVKSGGEKAFRAVYEKRGEAYFFEKVKPIFDEDDLTIVNLECALTKGQTRKDKQFAFRGSPAYAGILAAGGVDVANLANNHIKDYYTSGMKSTFGALKKAGIGACGRGQTYIADVRGVKVGFAGFTVWDNPLSDVRATLRKLRKDCDIMIVSMHWGKEGREKADAQQIEYGHAAVNAGADLVIGHHPHVVGGVEVYKGVHIVYSLGNFCFGGNEDPADKDAFIFRQTFTMEDGALTRGDAEAIPCTISSGTGNNFQPAPLSGSDETRVLGKIKSASRGFEQPAEFFTADGTDADADASKP